MALKIINLAIVTQKTGLSRSTIWRLERNGQFVPKIQLSPGRVGYLEHLVDEWLTKKCGLKGTSTVPLESVLPAGAKSKNNQGHCL